MCRSWCIILITNDLDIRLLRQMSCGFPWGHCQMFPRSVEVEVIPRKPRSPTVTFSLILNTSSFPKLIQEAQDSDYDWSISAREISTKLSLCLNDSLSREIGLQDLDTLMHQISSCWIHCCLETKI